jgi:Ca2+-transporting ATPase
MKKDVLRELRSNPETGLSTEIVLERQKLGLNELISKKGKPWIVRFLAQFKDVLIIILIIAALVSVIIDPSDFTESIVILLVVMINAFLGVYQESKAEKSLEALKKLSSPTAKVIRNSRILEVESKYLVPGDIIIVEAGDFVPADALLLEVSNLKVDESALTGESVSVEKTNEDLEYAVALGDRKNYLFSSTFVTYGRAKAIVTATGMNTEIGKIASLLNEHKESLTPLQGKLNQIGRIIGVFAIIICIVVFFIQWLFIYPDNALEAFKSAVALAVAAIPEGLSTVVTVILAMGVQKMVKHNAIVKKLPAVETLGSTEIVCSDKTGTLTQNKMTVQKLYLNSIKDVKSDKLTSEEELMLAYFALCSDASIEFIDGVEKRIGDPTETALIEVNNLYGLKDLSKLKRFADLPFDSERKMMSVIINYNGKILSITKGAPDIILKKSKNVDANSIISINNNMASQALRVLGVGIKYLDKVPAKLTSEELENDLEFVGLVGMIDPARPEALEAIKTAKKAGIRTIMITGDHVVTAKAIAAELGILNPGDLAITSEELTDMSYEELLDNIEKYSVYARVAPEDKVKIVKAWQEKGYVVAMTGDGVNDSPALKQADIGCAMGITGTDVAKEAASMVLVDDNFATIITAVEQGRGIYDNIKKTVQYLLSSNIGEVLTIFLATLITALGLSRIPFGIPLLPIHLLWINLITDTLPAFALGLEKPDDNIMNELPRKKNESFFSHGLGKRIILQGILVGLITLVSYGIGLFKSERDGFNNEQMHVIAQTMAFLTLSMVQLFHAFNIKSNKSIFNKQVFNNKYIWMAFFAGIVLQFGIIYIPTFASVFEVNALSLLNVLISVGMAFIVVIVLEIVKLIHRFVRK